MANSPIKGCGWAWRRLHKGLARAPCSGVPRLHIKVSCSVLMLLLMISVVAGYWLNACCGVLRRHSRRRPPPPPPSHTTLPHTRPFAPRFTCSISEAHSRGHACLTVRGARLLSTSGFKLNSWLQVNRSSFVTENTQACVLHLLTSWDFVCYQCTRRKVVNNMNYLSWNFTALVSPRKCRRVTP